MWLLPLFLVSVSCLDVELPRPPDDWCLSADGCGTPKVIDQVNAPVCAEVIGDRGRLPVDIIWTVDSSYSMREKLAWVEQNLISFFQTVSSFRVNTRIILLGAPFLAVPASINAEESVFLHVPEYVGSRDTLSKLLELYDRYRDFLRPEAKRVIIATTDDDSDINADDFDLALAALHDAAFDRGYVFHSIVSFGDTYRGCVSGAAVGHQYLRLTARTGGFQYQVCDPDWTGIFAALVASVRRLVDIPSQYPMPALPEGTVFAGASVSYADGSGVYIGALPQLEDETACASQPSGGWTLAQEEGHPVVHLCPEVCSADIIASVRVRFHCVERVN